MKLHIVILFILLFCTITSCSYENKYQDETSFTLNDFTEQQSLVGSPVNFDDIILRPNQIQIFDTLLITCNLGNERLFHIFNLKSKKKIGERISVGQGPDEMIQPYFIYNQKDIIIFDMITSIVSKYSIEEFINNPDPKAFEKIKIEEQVMSEINLLGNEMIGSLYRPEHPLYLFDKNGKKTKGFGAYPISNITYSDVEIVEAYRSIFTTNQNDKVAVCHFWTDLIDIYSKEGNLLKRLHGPKHIFPHFKEYNNGNIVTAKAERGTHQDAFYSPVNVGEDFFVLYNGKSLEEPEYNILSKQIFVFGWDGTPKQVFSLDQGVSRIAVDSKNKKIYGISNDPEYHIIEFSYK